MKINEFFTSTAEVDFLQGRIAQRDVGAKLVIVMIGMMLSHSCDIAKNPQASQQVRVFKFSR